VALTRREGIDHVRHLPGRKSQRGGHFAASRDDRPIGGGIQNEKG